MIAVDVLTVPVTQKGNRYLLVVQDYFTKWADAIPLPDQSACTITAALIKLFLVLGMPDMWSIQTKVVILKVLSSNSLLKPLG